jgi:ribonuclease R
MEVFKRQILSYVSRRDYSPVKLSGLVKALGVEDKDYADFKAAFTQLRRAGQIAIGPKNLIVLPEMSSRVIGTFRANPRGFGFIIPHQANSHGDLFVGPKDTSEAMTGDTVMAKVVKKGVRSGQMRYNGVIVEILERGKNEFVGTLRQSGAEWIVQPEGKGHFAPIVVEDVGAKQAKDNDKVVVEIIQYPQGKNLARGVITEVLGRAGLYDTETKSIIAQFHLPSEFNADCINQARKASESFDPSAFEHRDDITEETVITIDPPDAKDFDDAISLWQNSDDNWVLGVHIADVSHFVEMETALDAEARLRGNSVYLPRRVIPMLPEILSNGICSLQPGQRRFAKSVYITYDKKGNLLARNCANSVIESKARLTYEQAEMILRGKAAGFAGEVVALLKDMELLSHAIEKRRTKNGMLHLDLPETELIFDEEGRVIDAKPADDSYPHTIIEMFMVEANEAVASLLDRFGVPFMRRIHPEPEPGSLKNVGRFIKMCGLRVPRRLDRPAIQDLLKSVRGKSCSYAINMHILRSLQRAEYAPLHIGHFALASTHYCHFTSPIRRYADLMVHRLIQCYLEHRLNMIGLEEVLPEGELLEIGKHITFTEQHATEAERELRTVLILEMLSEHIGDELDCVVSGLTNFGVFVQCVKYGIEALIPPGDLGLDEWKYDDRAQAVVGRYSGKSVHLGESMRVRIVSVSLAARQLEVTPVKPLVSSRPQSPGKERRTGRKKRTYKRKPSLT